MPSVTYNGVRVWNAELDVEWPSGAFVARGEIPADGETVARFGSDNRCVIDGRACCATHTFELTCGHVTLRGAEFPWRREEWEG